VALNRTKIFAPNLSAVAMIATAFGVLEARELTFSSRADEIRANPHTPCSWDFALTLPGACSPP
jgi:hypothetical protein